MTVFNKANAANTKKIVLASAVLLGMSAVLSACSKDEHHEVSVVDKVEEAQALARANAPEPEIVELPVAQAPADAEATTDATTDTAANTTADATTQDMANAESPAVAAEADTEAASLGEPAPSSATDTAANSNSAPATTN